MGVSFVYAATGTLHLTQIADRLPHVDPDSSHTLAQPGVVLTLVGFAFKTAAVPFHFWVPDTYVGAPAADRRLPLGRRQGRRLLRPDPRHRRRLPVVRGRLGPGAGRPGRPHHDRRQRRRPAPAAHARVQRRTPARLVLRRPGRLPPGADRRRRLLRATPAHAIGSTVAYALMYAAVNLGAFAVAALVARRSPAEPHQRLPGPVRPPPAGRARPGLLPALPGRSAAGHHRPLRQGHRLLGGRRRGARLAGRRHGRQRRDRALLLPAVDGAALPRPPRAEPGGRHRPRAPALTAAIALTAVLGIVLSGAPQLVLRFAETGSV